ncbi:MAG: hypothetical protein ACTSRG_14225 [Candidatus Helarchaeota archaeon]
MTDQIGDGEIKSIIFGNSKINFYRGKYELLYIIRTIRKSKDVNIERTLKLIEEEFLSKYKKEIENWTGNLSIFENFQENIEKIFYDSPKDRTIRAIW